MLAQLGWSDLALPQVSASGGRREDVPDLLLFPDLQAKTAALKEKRDARRYRQGIALLESKRWLRALDRGDSTDRLDPGTPSNQMLRYLSAAEVAFERGIRWGILSNGAAWRLYYQGARDDAAYILDTFPILREEDEKAHGRYLTKDLVLAYLNAVAAGDLESKVTV